MTQVALVWTQGIERVAQTQIVLYGTHDGSSRLLDPSPAGGQWLVDVG